MTDSPFPLHPQPGSTIDPSNAIGRHETTERANQALAAGNNLVLTDPRRMGKTVWLDLFCSQVVPGRTAIKIDYEGVQTSREFLTRTVGRLRHLQKLNRRISSALGVFFDGAEVSTGSVSIKVGVASRSAADLFTDAIHAVSDNLDAEHLVIAMDEVPIALSNIAKNEGSDLAGQLLQTLRNLRGEAVNVQWIVCGSIGFHHVLRLCNTTEGAINDLVNLRLGPLTEDDAKHLAHRLMVGIDRQPAPDHLSETLDEMLVQTDGIPFLIHSLANLMHQAGSGPARVDDVRGAFQWFVDDRDESRAATHLVTRLNPNYGRNAGLAGHILDTIALHGPLRHADLDAAFADQTTSLVPTINDLLDDHYLVERSGQLTWRYSSLRRIWVARRKLS